ncbi:MAG: choice-of-anchor D domain-containing protein [Bacteroidales bacterium]|nr:choice-of-anchor D domain-containing protein [Bacteroidales bacterium]
MKKINSKLPGTIRLVKYFCLVYIFTILINPEIYSQNGSKDWTILESWLLDVSGQASGLATDGTYFYFGIYGVDGDKVYKFDPSNGTVVLLFSTPEMADAFGMSCDGSSIWTTDHANSSTLPAYAMQFDFSGNLLQQIDLPDHYMSGIDHDNDDLWVATYYPDPGVIYKIDIDGNILSQFQTPGTQAWDICRENDYMWVADYNDDKIYKTDLAGNILESHASENIQPSGITFDGQYLWYVDGGAGTSKIYKVDLQGSGTPEIEVPVTEYNFGNVAFGDSAVWNCQISNTGDADLIIENLIIQNAVPIFVYLPIPQTITPGNTIEIPFIYKPQDPIPLYTIATVESNDPVTPQVELELTGEGVYPGPHINVISMVLNYGDIRLNATKRWFLQVENNGSETLQVENILLDNLSFYLDDAVQFPINIGVLQIAEIGIWFNPESTGTFEGIATVEHSDPTQYPIEVELTGSGFDQDYPIGEPFWNYNINTSFDNSVKAIMPIPDVSGDGVEDVIVGSEDYFIRCFNGNASGTTEVLWEIEIGSVANQNDLAMIEDIDDDDFPDVIMGKTGIGSVNAISGKTGELIWSFSTEPYGDGWIYQVWPGFDYNDDGFTDVLASSGGLPSGSRRIFCIDGLTGDEIWDSFTNGPNFSVIGVDDFTGDDKPDVIGGASNSNETEGKVYGMNGTNGNIEWTYTTSGSSVWALVQLEDINDDGFKDIIAGDFGGNYYLIDVTNGNPLQNGSVGPSIILRWEKMDDVNADGYPDVAVSKIGSFTAMIDGYSGEHIWEITLVDQSYSIDRIGDISGDGINDLIIGTIYNTNYCYFIDGTNGETIHSFNFGEPVDGISAMPDINGDGSMEMIAGGREGKLFCYSGGLNSALLSADFAADPTTGVLPLEVQFTDLSTGANIWEWDFNYDGTIDSYEQNPQYTYEAGGLYTVSLIAGNGITTDTSIKIDYINVLTTGIEKSKNKLANLEITPNPFLRETVISYRLYERNSISIDIYDLQGNRIIDLLPHQLQESGSYSIPWNGTDNNGGIVQPGIYICNLRSNEIVTTRKIIRK